MSNLLNSTSSSRLVKNCSTKSMPSTTQSLRQLQVAPLSLVTPISHTTTKPNVDYSLSLFQRELDNIQPLKVLLDLVTRNTDPRVVFINFFAHNFIESHKSFPQVDNRMRCECQKIKAAVRVMTRLLDTFPSSKPSPLEEADIAMKRIKTALLSEASSVKTQGKHSFNAATPLHLSIIRSSETLLSDKSKSWCRPLHQTPLTLSSNTSALTRSTTSKNLPAHTDTYP